MNNHTIRSGPLYVLMSDLVNSLVKFWHRSRYNLAGSSVKMTNMSASGGRRNAGIGGMQPTPRPDRGTQGTVQTTHVPDGFAQGDPLHMSPHP
jgi:hypothetical protein